MTAAMPFLMAYMLIGAQRHEWMGTGVFVLFIIHHIINHKWLTTLTKGRYNAARTANLVINVLIFLCMIGLMYSGIVMSRYVFSSLKISGGAALARKLHMLCSYWGLVLMSVHLGAHWSFVMGAARKMFRLKKSTARSVVLTIITAAMAGYGVYAFIKRSVLDYLLLKIQFVFFDTNEPVIYFLLDYAAIMALFAAAGLHFTPAEKADCEKGGFGGVKNEREKLLCRPCGLYYTDRFAAGADLLQKDRKLAG